MENIPGRASHAASSTSVLSDSGSDHGRSHRHQAHRSRQELRATIEVLRKQRRVLAGTTLGFAGASLALGYAVLQARSSMQAARAYFDEERQVLQKQLTQFENSVTELRTSLASTRREIETLVQKRIPGLLRLEFGQVIPIREHYVRHIAFKPVGGSNKLAYEYKVVVENTSNEPAWPALSLFLFDEWGVQVGRSQIAGNLQGAERELRTGEIRSHFGVLELDRPRPAAYFLIDAH